MTYRVIIQPRAEQDIQQAALYILEQSKSPATAQRWARSIRAKLDTLRFHPLRCPIDPDSDAYGTEVRLLLYGRKRSRYSILFTVQSDMVRVLTVRHAAQRGIGDESDDPDPGAVH